MKALCKQAEKNRARIARDEAKKRHEEMLANMTLEERAEYEKEQEARMARAKEHLANLAAIRAATQPWSYR